MAKNGMPIPDPTQQHSRTFGSSRKMASSLASTVRELQRHERDPQCVLSSLVQFHELLASLAPSASLSLSTGSLHLSDAVKILHNVLQHYLHAEEEIVWYVCRVVSVWSRSSHRFKLEAGHVRMWTTLQQARAAHPESPRVLDTSLDATASLFHGVELHQLWGSSHEKLFEELLLLMDRFDTPPARLLLLSPHYDFSRLLVLAFEVLYQLLASPRVVSATCLHKTQELHARLILTRMRSMLAHFLKTSDASRTWLAMARLQLKYAPAIALEILFVEAPVILPTSSWCLELMTAWRHDPLVVYDLVALFTQIFAVPHGCKSIRNDEVANAVMQDHGVLEILLRLLSEYSTHVRNTRSQVDRYQSVVLEIVRAIRQLSCVPEMLAVFPTIPLANQSLVLALVAQVDSATCGLGSDTLSQYHMHVLLELVLTLRQLIRVPIFARAIKTADSLSTRLTQAAKRVASIENSTLPSCQLDMDAGDSELPAVLLREVEKTTKAIAALPTTTSSSSSRTKMSTTSRGLQRLPASSSALADSSKIRSIPQTILSSSSVASSSHSLRRLASTSSSSLILGRTTSQRHS